MAARTGLTLPNRSCNPCPTFAVGTILDQLPVKVSLEKGDIGNSRVEIRAPNGVFLLENIGGSPEGSSGDHNNP